MAEAPAEAFVSSQRIKDFITLAYSTRFNRRSLEGFWYPPYTQTISDLTNFPIPNGSLCAAERFYLDIPSALLKELKEKWRNSALDSDDDEGDSEEEGDGNVTEVDDDSSDGDSSDDSINLADVSMETAATMADASSVDKFPDLMISHIEVVQREEPALASVTYQGWERRLGARAFHQCFPLIGEFKTAPKRKLREAHPKFDPERAALVNEALEDLVIYIAMYFDRDPHAHAVIGLVGAGPWWKWARITRKAARPYLDVASRRRGSQKYLRVLTMLKRIFSDRPLAYLGKPASDEQWTKLRASLITILNRHAHYPVAPV